MFQKKKGEPLGEVRLLNLSQTQLCEIERVVGLSESALYQRDGTAQHLLFCLLCLSAYLFR